jgi:hypothetical protein
MYQSEEYFLMHKNIKVAKFSMTDYGTSINIIEIYNEKHMPYGTHVPKKHLNEKFAEWKKGRGIPNERPYLMQIYRKTKKSIPELETYNMGLSMCDCYWFKPIDSEKTWEEVSFILNGFPEQIGRMLLNANIDTPSVIKSADLTLSGECPKMWSRFNDTTWIVKGCRLYADTKVEICNEVFASLLAEKIGVNTVQYYMMRSGEAMDFCCAETFIKNDSFDFVTFQQIANDTNTLGVNGVLKFIQDHNMQDYLNHLIVLDFIIGNYNRTLSDMGVLVNSDTMEFISPAPLFDFEESMDSDLLDDDIQGVFSDPIKLQLKMVSDFSWLDFEAIDDAIDEMDRIYALGGFKSAEINSMKKYIKNRVMLLKKEIPANQIKRKKKTEFVPNNKKKDEKKDDIVKIHIYDNFTETSNNQ